MKTIPFTPELSATITQMREGAAFGATPEELHDGNMVPGRCALGNKACAQICQLRLGAVEGSSGKLCAANNVLRVLEESNIDPANFAMIAAVKDRVGFGDDLASMGATKNVDGYTAVPDCNAFFFRPGQDTNLDNHETIHDAAMRMADCGMLGFDFFDKQGNPVAGIAHFSRSNMFGPSGYQHQIDGRPVSWGEYILTSAVNHYGVDPQDIQVRLFASVDGKDFIQSGIAGMEERFPGWNELGFVRQLDNDKYEVDYRSMIRWQLTDGIQDPALKIPETNITTNGAINTGDISLGHASHHLFSAKGEIAGKIAGKIADGRDMYMIGLKSTAQQ